MPGLGLLRAVGVFVAGVCVTGVATAQTPPRPQPPAQRPPMALPASPEAFIKQFDRDNDGVLTAAELPERLKEAMGRFDGDRNGKLDQTEVGRLIGFLRQRAGGAPGAAPSPAAIQRVTENLLNRLDTNKDGKISREEAQGPLRANFGQFDTDNNGVIDQTELRQLARRFAAGQQGGPGGAPVQANPFDFDAMDRNADGRLTRDEVRPVPVVARQFDEIDGDKSGQLDRREFNRFVEKQQAGRQPGRD